MTIVYHGSKALFQRFDYSKMGQNGTSEGFGFYFTNNRNIAEGYAQNGYLYTVEFNGKKSLSSTKKTITKNQLKKLLIELDKRGQYLSNYGDTEFEGFEKVLSEAILNVWEYSNNDVDMICDICTAYGSREEVLTTLYQMFGYDSIQVPAEWGQQDLYIALVNDIITIKEVTKQ